MGGKDERGGTEGGLLDEFSAIGHENSDVRVGTFVKIKKPSDWKACPRSRKVRYQGIKKIKVHKED